ncbi:MAG: hypothetical protein R2856_36560 [Caldilineaceae bacterium]
MWQRKAAAGVGVTFMLPGLILTGIAYLHPILASMYFRCCNGRASPPTPSLASGQLRRGDPRQVLLGRAWALIPLSCSPRTQKLTLALIIAIILDDALVAAACLPHALLHPRGDDDGHRGHR